MNSARSSSLWMIPGLKDPVQSARAFPGAKSAKLTDSFTGLGTLTIQSRVAQHVFIYIYICFLIQWLWPSQIFLFLFLWKCAELPPKLDSRRGYFHIQLNPSREHFRPWPRSIPFCSTKVNKILEALQTRVDRILHSLKTGIHWDNGIYHDILIYIYIYIYIQFAKMYGESWYER